MRIIFLVLLGLAIAGGPVLAAIADPLGYFTGYPGGSGSKV